MRKKIIYSRFVADVISWGADGTSFSKGEMLNLLQYCVEKGITSFAHNMKPGNFATSNTFGAALSESGLDRSEFQVISRMDEEFFTSESSKAQYFSKQKITESVDEALLQLKIDFLDLFLLKKDALPIEEMEELTDQLKFQGKIKEFGLVAPSPADYSSIKIKSDAFWTDFSILKIEKNVQQIFKNKKEDFFLENPLGDFFDTTTKKIQKIEAVLEDLMPKYKANKPQLLLAWFCKLSSQVHPIISAGNEQKVDNAGKAAKLEMEQPDFDAILQAATE